MSVTGPPRAQPSIASDSALLQLVGEARAAGRLAVDTEFMGEGRYRTLLCLIQLATPPTPELDARVELLDPLQEQVDMAPLAQLLADPSIEIVVHAGRQDIALLRRQLKTDVCAIFDTQLAAGFAGMPAQSSYESLLMAMLGIRVAKSASFTRWDARPLSPEQLAYAREDVVHLLELSEALQDRLEGLGRLGWARQECESLQHSSDERDPDAIFARLPRIRGLSPACQALARALVDWRERTAELKDRPAQSVLQDAVLVEIAKRRPSSTRQLEEIRGVGQSLVRRFASDVLEVVAEGRERTQALPARTGATSPPDPADAPLIALSESLVRARSREAGLAYELLASRAELQSIVAARRLQAPEPQVRTLSGWRRELVGEELLALLDGRVSLSVHDGQLRVD